MTRISLCKADSTATTTPRSLARQTGNRPRPPGRGLRLLPCARSLVTWSSGNRAFDHVPADGQSTSASQIIKEAGSR